MTEAKVVEQDKMDELIQDCCMAINDIVSASCFLELEPDDLYELNDLLTEFLGRKIRFELHAADGFGDAFVMPKRK